MFARNLQHGQSVGTLVRFCVEDRYAGSNRVFGTNRHDGKVLRALAGGHHLLGRLIAFLSRVVGQCDDASLARLAEFSMDRLASSDSSVEQRNADNASSADDNRALLGHATLKLESIEMRLEVDLADFLGEPGRGSVVALRAGAMIRDGIPLLRFLRDPLVRPSDCADAPLLRRSSASSDRRPL